MALLSGLLGFLCFYTLIWSWAMWIALRPPAHQPTYTRIRLFGLNLTIDPQEYRVGLYVAIGTPLFILLALSPLIEQFTRLGLITWTPARVLSVLAALAKIAAFIFAWEAAGLFTLDIARTWAAARHKLLVIATVVRSYLRIIVATLITSQSLQPVTYRRLPTYKRILIHGRHCLACLFDATGVPRFFALTRVLQIKYAF